MSDIYYYHLKAYKDRLTLAIESPAEKNTKEILYSVSFFPEEKEIRIGCNLYGSLDMWLNMIREGEIRAVNAEDDLAEIRKVFPVVQEIFSLEMFAYIYKTKGLHFKPLIESGKEKEYLTLHREILSQNITGNDAVIRTKLHKLPDKNLILEIDVALFHGKRHVQILISEDFTYSVEALELSFLFYLERIVVGESTEADIMEFSRCYPSFGLSEYWKNGGQNILLPLLSGNYHKGIELLSKSGCCGTAAYKNLPELYRNPAEYTDVRSFLGVPVSVVRKISLEHLKKVDGLFTKIAEIWDYNRSILDVPAYTVPMFRFIKENDISHRMQPDSRRTPFHAFSEEQVVKIIRYLAADPLLDYEMFRGYLHICSLIHAYPAGMTPGNLPRAFDVAVRMYRELENRRLSEDFRMRVSEFSYAELTTETGPDRMLFEEDQYMIIAPGNLEDLARESTIMHNCVCFYSERIVRGVTKIYLLRKRKNPSIPFVTIQVDADRVVQVKTAYNRLADAEIQLFIRKWAAIKGLLIDTEDIGRTA